MQIEEIAANLKTCFGFSSQIDDVWYVFYLRAGDIMRVLIETYEDDAWWVSGNWVNLEQGHRQFDKKTYPEVAALIDEERERLFPASHRLRNPICTNCNSNKIIEVSSKVRDSNFIQYHWMKKSYCGYLPESAGLGGTYLEIAYCANCGMLQGEFPLKVDEQEPIDENWDDIL